MESEKTMGTISAKSKWLTVVSRFSLVAGICVLGFFISFFLFLHPSIKGTFISKEFLEITIRGLIHLFYVLLNSGGFLGGLLLILIAFIGRLMTFFSLRSTLLIAASGIVLLTRAIIELASGINTGFMSILAGILLICTFFSLAGNILRSGKFTSIIKEP